MPVRESPDELTLRADEVGTWKSWINVDHIAKERWGPHLVDADSHAFCQALFQGIEGEDWKELYVSYKVMSRAVGLKSHRRPRKQKNPEMKAAKDAREEYYDPEREDNILGINKTRQAPWAEQRSDYSTG